MKTVIGSEAFLISTECEGQTYRVLWGVVAADETGRWHLGDYCCTTPIQESEDLGDGVTRYKTRSGSTYEARCPVEPYFCRSPEDYFKIYRGMSPAEVEIFHQHGLKVVEVDMDKPQIHKNGSVSFILISELPAEEREPFRAWLFGRGCPWPEGEQRDNCAYPWDYQEWKNEIASS